MFCTILPIGTALISRSTTWLSERRGRRVSGVAVSRSNYSEAPAYPHRDDHARSEHGGSNDVQSSQPAFFEPQDGASRRRVNGELLQRVLRKLGRGRRDVFPVED